MREGFHVRRHTHGGPPGLRRTERKHCAGRGSRPASLKLKRSKRRWPHPAPAEAHRGAAGVADRAAVATAASPRRRPRADGAAAKDPAETGEDYTDPPPDRGLTSEDVAADARVEAGLADAEPGAVTRADRAGVPEAEDR